MRQWYCITVHSSNRFRCVWHKCHSLGMCPSEEFKPSSFAVVCLPKHITLLQLQFGFLTVMQYSTAAAAINDMVHHSIQHSSHMAEFIRFKIGRR